MTTNFSIFFKQSTRNKGDEVFITLRDDRPDWLQDAVREAHHDTLPNDWIYEECHAAVEAFDAGDLDGKDAAHEYTDGRVDIYTKTLYQWAADFCLTDTWAEAEQEATDMGMPEETEKRIAAIQYAAIRHIVETMQEACQKAERGEEMAS